MPIKVANGNASHSRHSPMEHPRHQYPRETEALQDIAKSCGLTEVIKWGKPCFTLEDRNVVLIQRFNSYIALLFFKGVLLKDPEKLLHRVGTQMQGPRQLRFSSVAEIIRIRPTIESLIKEAIELEKSGAKVQLRPYAELVIPDELLRKFKTDLALKEAFAALTPGRQKGYVFQIAAAKQSSTRVSRIEKYTPQILAGKGYNE